ncbi:MAG TPA: hypothetical protein VMR49_02445 [Candidatus Paceibacterota bacterium]|nr:hypothetical protein [Candidatus Paceibacterota bacterium]
MSFKIKALFCYIIVLGMFLLPMVSRAVLEIGLQESDINVSTAPENPEPYQDVSITLKSYSTDLDKAMIEWKSGKNVVLSGYGKTSYSFKASGPNTSTAFSVTITTADGSDQITIPVVITPSEIEILWEGSDSYTPPFYRGKAFVSPDGLIKAVAIPDTGIISDQGNVTYTWQNNGSAVLDASGYNKNSYVFPNSEINTSENVSVTASSVNGQYNATGSIKIPIISPKIIFYEKSPTEGILYNRALADEASMSANENEMTIIAEPYFAALRGNEDKFTYQWQINGGDIDTPANKTELTIQPTSRGGYADIGLDMENLNTLFQKVSGQLRLNM